MIQPIIKKCDICKKQFTGHGHSSHPLRGEKCCDTCHNKKVLLARLALHQQYQQQKEGD